MWFYIYNFDILYLSLCIKRPEIDCTLTQLESLINKIVALRQVLQLLPSLHEILQKFTSKICREAVAMFTKNVNSSVLLLEMMLLILASDVVPRLALKENKFGKLSVIRDDVNGLLDMARTTFREYVEKLENEISLLRQERFYNCLISLGLITFHTKNQIILYKEQTVLKLVLVPRLPHETPLDQKQRFLDPSYH